MKKILLLLPLLLLAGYLAISANLQEPQSDAKGIEFFHGTYPEALAKSKELNKPIFMDVYAEWCGPCKLMSSQIFTDPEVGVFFNENFINYKVDAESDIGKPVARKFHITAYPSLVFVDNEGNEILRSEGARPKDKLINLGKRVLSELSN